MRCPSRLRLLSLHATFTLLAVCTAAACSGPNSEANATGTAGAGPAPFAIEVSQTYITVENRTGAALAGGQMEIIPGGVLPPFRTTLPRLEAGSRRDILLNAFRGGDGTPFNRAIARARRVKITAKDLVGKVYEYEVPFN